MCLPPKSPCAEEIQRVKPKRVSFEIDKPIVLQANPFVLHEYNSKFESVQQELFALKKELCKIQAREQYLSESVNLLLLLLSFKRQKNVTIKDILTKTSTF